MKKAIISGATGLVGMAVSKHLSLHGIQVLGLGRQHLSREDIDKNLGEGSSYIRLAMEDIALLPDLLASIGWTPETECVFFNFAWRGREKLTDGSFGDQLKNAVQAAEAVKVAKKLGCIKFVNSGTLEETFIEPFLEGKRDDIYQSAQTDYALAKIASRDMCKMVSYLEKIDYVHTRLSVPLAPDLSRGSYVAATLKKITEGKPYEAPKNSQLFDITFIDDVTVAYHLIGLKGKNKADYFIGTSKPIRLDQFFKKFERIFNNDNSEKTEPLTSSDAVHFDTQSLYKDTGFVATKQLRDMIRSLPTP